MKMKKRETGRSIRGLLYLGLAIMLLMTSPALGVKVGDITHLQGSRINRLTGFGLVTGLNGTGDGGKNAPAMRALARAYERFGAPIATIEELKDSKNVALVFVEATLPRDGAREGERIDVKVSSPAAAKSLLGGRLLPTPLVGPDPNDPTIWAMASGPVHLDDLETPTVGSVAGGAVLEQSWVHNYLVPGRELERLQNANNSEVRNWIRADEHYVTFVIDQSIAEWGVASTIAQTINEYEAIVSVSQEDLADRLAFAFDPRTVLVRVPATERKNPAPYLARLEEIPLFMPFTQARVSIDRRAGTIIITGEVEIAPAVISHKGLTITTLMPEPPRNAANPQVVEKEFLTIDPQRKAGAKLRDLEEALNQLKVPVEDRITIIERLHKTGKLYATLEVED